jgi:endonuclease/exonuclease/phosphatase family metal-dependent hydrolase
MRFALPLRGGAAETASSHDRLTLLTFNVPEARVSPSIAGFVRSTDADLVALQEVTLRSGRRGAPLRLPSALQAILDTTTHRVPTLPPGLRVQQPVLTRIAVDSLRVLPIPGGPTASATRVAFTWQGRRAVLYNVHLHSVSRVKPWRASLSRMRDLAFWRTAVADYREGARMRAAQARTLRRLVDRESVPVIVAGDLNSTPHDWVYHHLAAGMQDVYALRGATGGATYPADEPLVRIDHVLVSEAWDAVAARVLDEHPWSDHRPVVVQLRWK